MTCENCHGIRPKLGEPPCRSCGGTGIMNCCEGPVGNAEFVGNNPIEHKGKPGGTINRADFTPEPPDDFDECENCEDFDECLGIGVCLDQPLE
jgi:hypothetical protein